MPELDNSKNHKEEESYYAASQWRLIWIRFKKHKVAMGSLVVIGIMYLLVLFCEFFAPLSPYTRYIDYPLAPPQKLRFIDAEGKFHIQPFVYGIEQSMDSETFKRTYPIKKRNRYTVRFLVHGAPYKLWGLLETNIHFFGVADADAPFFLWGTDRQGRDLLSRVIYGTRISLSIGLIGVVLGFVLGVILGGISGFFGGLVDNVVQRIIEILRSIPTLPLWMALAAALPQQWSIIRIYFFITLILSLRSWTGIARVVRGKFLSMREEDFVAASEISGASYLWIIRKHMVPAIMSHVIAAATLSAPAMIIGETSLSFLGIGLRAPAISWGVLLQDAQNVQTVLSLPWLLLPCIFVILAVLAFNFVGDGLRDAVDPYSH